MGEKKESQAKIDPYSEEFSRRVEEIDTRLSIMSLFSNSFENRHDRPLYSEEEFRKLEHERDYIKRFIK